jgi:DMSO/TMAO reductase YedYZ heme-binding membrane subunit
MSAKRKAQHTEVFGWAGLGALLLVALVILLRPPTRALDALVRGAALLGYLCIFASILSSLYLRELVRYFGRPFAQVHHVATVAGLVLVTVHPLAVALSFGTFSVIWPKFGSWGEFFMWAGAPAFDLLVIAALAGLLRNRIKNAWRPIHMLTYLAFLLGTIHGTLLGTDLSRPLLRIVAVLMALVVAYVAVRRRLGAPKRTPKKAS